MAKKRDESAPASEALEEIESVFDRVANWVSSNPMMFLLAIGGLLAVAAGYGLFEQNRRTQALEASEAVASAQYEYFQQSGSAPGFFAETEPANPEAAKELREQYLKRFLELADEHSGSVAGLQAGFEAADIAMRLEGPEKALELLRKARADVPRGSAFEAVAALRMATTLESIGRWKEAGDMYAEAADVPGFPGRAHALAEAARCMLEAGDEPGARAMYSTLGAEAPDHPLAPYIQARLDRLVEPMDTASQEAEVIE